ncbi:MAG: hypothetical protein WCC27_12280 [Acidobacteriaceae bacterium]
MNWKWFWAAACLLIIGVSFAESGYFTAFLCAAAAPFAVSLAVRRKVSKLMMAKSAVQPATALDESDSPEVLATTTPRFLASSDFAPSDELVAVRESLVARSQRRFWRAFLRDALAGVGYCIIPALVAWAFRHNQSGLGALVAGVIFISLLLRLLFHRNQFRPVEADFKGGMFTDFIFVVILREFSRPRNLLPIVLCLDLVCIVTLLPDWVSVLGLLLAVAFHCLLMGFRMPKTDHNVRLVILRVFGLRKNAVFTFGRLVHFWEHLGSYFTVVDPSFLSFEYRLLSTRIVFVFSLSLLLMWTLEWAVRSAFKVSQYSLAGLLLAIGGAVAFLIVLVAVEFFRIKRAFVKSGADLETRLLRLEKNPRRFSDLSFKDMPTMCYDNTWKMAVSAFAKSSDVVLMDLRGFSEARKGCAYEIDFLLDNVPVDRVVFLVDGHADPGLIHQFILERWQRLRITSPNLKLEAPAVRLYLSTEQNERDVQGIFDHLLEAAVSGGRAQAVLGGAIAPPATIKYKNFEDMPLSRLSLELHNGTRFVQYEYCISLGTSSFHRQSRVHLLQPGQSRRKRGLHFTVLTFFLGWWGIPFGPILTVKCIYRNCAGGIDLTGKVASFVASQEDCVRAWTTERSAS